MGYIPSQLADFPTTVAYSNSIKGEPNFEKKFVRKRKYQPLSIILEISKPFLKLKPSVIKVRIKQS